MNKLLVCLFIFFSAFLTDALGQNRYFIFYSDKDGSPYSIERPEEFLSERSIERRVRQNIPVVEEDLPVNPFYVEQILEAGIDVFYSSKWLNGSLVQTSSSNIEAIESLSFVDSVLFLAPNSRLTFTNGRRSKKRNRRLRNRREDEFEGSIAQLNMLEVPQMHEQSFTGEGMMIGVFDGGFGGVDTDEEIEHIFQRNGIVDKFNFVLNNNEVFDFSRHGTQVFSTMASSSPNLLGVVPDADYILYVTEDVPTEFRIEEMNWLLAAERADSVGVDVINTSVGYIDFDDPSMTYSFEDLDGETILVTIAAEKAFSKGIVVVCSAGNERGFGAFQGITGPADGENVIAVGAISQDTLIANFSSSGPNFNGQTKPDVVAQGVQTLVSMGVGTRRNNGTSFASPLIAGLIAGFWQSNRALTALEIVTRVRRAGHLFGTGNTNNLFGFGIPSFSRLENASSEVITSVEEELGGEVKVYPNPVDKTELYIIPGNEFVDKDLKITVYDLNGNMKLEQSATQRINEDDPIVINMVDLIQGTYIINISDGIKEYSTRVIKR